MNYFVSYCDIVLFKANSLFPYYKNLYLKLDFMGLVIIKIPVIFNFSTGLYQQRLISLAFFF